MKTDIKVPAIGDFANVPVVEVSVAVGDIIAVEDTVVMLESDKATLDIPSPVAGRVTAIHIAVGDRVSEGSAILEVESETELPAERREAATQAVAAQPANAPLTTPSVHAAPGLPDADAEAELVVIGAGPGGYTAAFRAADLGLKVTLVERDPNLGGVCLNVGCIPSKALLHAAKVIDEAAAMSGHGITYPKPEIDIDRLRAWKSDVVGKLTGGLTGLARRRKVKILRGSAVFEGGNLVRVSHGGDEKTIAFKQAIIACGSEPVRLPFLPDDDRIIDSTGALELADIPKRMLVLGGGIIGLEMAQVYHALGARITIVELMDQIIPGADRDIVAPLMKRIEQRYENVRLKTKVTKVQSEKTGLRVTFEGPEGTREELFDKILSAVGRRPNGRLIGAEKAGISVDEGGFIRVDRQMRTSRENIFAIGDVVGQPMLAHKATHEGKVAAEVAAGHKSAFDAPAIPSVAYTEPEVGWVGLTENEARSKGIAYKKASFPWAASGRALAMAGSDGVSKLLFDPDSGRVLGAGICGPNAGELLAEVALAIEMGADAEDLSLTIHPHPTLSETIGLAAEIFEGTITDL
ncbi:dihydrolipoyl dehydrogenase [Martelella mediterranea]|uniref:dihydrolipoyl dehydrogenase n=1 Tax=Martelella mediterranea TaxID=293089 RepID=UPI001E31EFD9|nr:dihydrolipoyl dehydrogenase [Martelella mediterranea]MCD1634720.1 dihydrolipoyl dehydrogenase [Martelella mediterranea]